jgi:glycosyltransferase involved in cell wall biosynthesis
MADNYLFTILGITSFFFCVQLVYWFIFLRLALYQTNKEHQKITTSQQGISIVVAAHNEAENLTKLLPALLAQQYENYEIIVIDDRSYDETRQVIFDAQKLSPKIKLVRIDHKPEEPDGKKFALTMGIKAAKNEWLLFTDADCLPNSPDWLAEMSAQFGEEKSFVLGISQYQKQGGLLNAFIQFETFMTALQYLSWALAGSPYMGVGRNLAYRKSIFMANNGFYRHTTVTGGDDDLLINRLATGSNTAICVNTASQTTSVPKQTWETWYAQKKRHLSVGKYYKFSDKIRTSLFTFSIFFFWLALLLQVFVGWWLQNEILLYSALAMHLLRWLIAVLVLLFAQDKLAAKAYAGLYPFIEPFYVVYQLLVGLIALTTEKVTWR